MCANLKFTDPGTTSANDPGNIFDWHHDHFSIWTRRIGKTTTIFSHSLSPFHFSDFPRPVVTRAESTSSSSFELAWTFPKDDIRLYDGFSVKYCPSSTALCIKTQTKEKKLTVQGLNPDTTFAIEVRAQFRKTDGNLLLGPPASESVTTWKDVPDFRITYETNIQEDVGTHLLSWECVKSDLDYIQYRTTETGNWTTCSDSADCDATVNHVRTTMFSSGYLRLTIQQIPLSEEEVWFRGCNDHGCGQEHSLSLYSLVSGNDSAFFETVIRRCCEEETQPQRERDGRPCSPARRRRPRELPHSRPAAEHTPADGPRPT
ncbi:uncharacterized protein LOC125944107 [Dermacentor silvarum]|uniref:uncharacterized protein LOC125944107 n=1 Tax=Dermacentor silvarum TaxID=543639 RepID=UPI00210181F5|nr:uncharacterized protein LOC125944107 [Dermacentor silvarum]